MSDTRPKQSYVGGIERDDSVTPLSNVSSQGGQEEAPGPVIESSDDVDKLPSNRSQGPIQRVLVRDSKYSRVEDEITVLQLSCFGHWERAHALTVEHPYLINQEGDMGNQEGDITPLMWAASQGNKGIVASLTAHPVPEIHQKSLLYQQTALHFACFGGHAVATKALLYEGARIDACDGFGFTPLMLATSEGHHQVATELLDAGADIQVRDNVGRTALHHACMSGHCGTVVRFLLILEDVDLRTSLVNQGDYFQLTPLMLAASRGHGKVVRFLTKSPIMAKVQLKSKTQQTALHFACLGGHLRAAATLLDAGADVNEPDELGLTPLMLAASENHGAVIKCLCDTWNASVREQDNGGRTALHIACLGGHLEAAAMLLDGGADVNEPDELGLTPLMLAASEDHSAVIVCLCDTWNASVREQDNDGRTALHIAAEKGAKASIRCLTRRSRADIDQKDDNHRTPLVAAAIKRQYIAAVYLIQLGANIRQLLNYERFENRDLDKEVVSFAIQANKVRMNFHYTCALFQQDSATLPNWDTYRPAFANWIVNVLGNWVMPIETELMWSSHMGYDSLVKYLILQGVDVNVQNVYGNTALHYAARGNHIQCGLLLAKAGASVTKTNILSQTPLYTSVCTKEFRNGILELLSFQTKKICCVLGNTLNGKSTLIASLQNENANWLTKARHWLFGVSNISQRTAGIEPVSLASKRYGNVLFYDFAGQSEYHGPHELFLESIISRGVSSVAVIVVVNITEKQSVMFQQVNRWLQPFYKLPPATNPIPVFLVGSHYDKAKKPNEAKHNLATCCEELKNQGGSVLQFGSICCLDCRQPYAPDIQKLCRSLRDVPLPQCEDSHTGYSLPWVISQIRSSFTEEVVPLSQFAAWIDQNKANLPTNLPPAEDVCRDLASTGHFLYLPSTGTRSGGWLVLDLPSILKDVYGNLFTSGKSQVNEFGLLSCAQLPSLFPRFDSLLVFSILVSLGFGVEVDSSFLSEATHLTKSTDCQCEYLFIPALVTATQPDIFSKVNESASMCCWQFVVDKKLFLSPRILQAVILRLAGHHIFSCKQGSEVKPLGCSVWLNGIFWKSCRDVDVAVQISDNTTIRVIGCSEVSGEALCNYMATVVQDIAATIKSIDASIRGSVYIICLPSGNPQLMLGKSKPSTHQTFPIEAVVQSIKSGSESTISLDSADSTGKRKAISELFGGFKPSLEAVQGFFVLQDPQLATVQPNSDPSGGPTTPTEPHPNHVLPTTDLEPQVVSPGTSCNPDCYHGTTLTTPTGPTLTTPTDSVLPSPNMETLDSLVVYEVAARWRQVGVHLGMAASALDIIQANYPSDVVQCCHEMFSKWLLSKKGTGTKPRTWETVLSILEKADFFEIAADLRKDLDPLTAS